MDKKQTIIIASVLILALTSFLFITNMTGNAITRTAASPRITSDYFKIDDFGSQNQTNQTNETSNDEKEEKING